MLILCVIAITLAQTALVITAWPYLRAMWEKYRMRARLHRRIAMLKRL
jgi:hypothetical protein